MTHKKKRTVLYTKENITRIIPYYLCFKPTTVVCLENFQKKTKQNGVNDTILFKSLS